MSDMDWTPEPRPWCDRHCCRDCECTDLEAMRAPRYAGMGTE